MEEEKEMDRTEIISVGVDRLISLRKKEGDLRTRFNELKAEFEEKNLGLMEEIDLAKQKRTEQEVYLKEQRCLQYELTLDKSKICGIGIRVMKDFVYSKKAAFNWAVDHKIALKLDEPTFKKMAVAEELDFVEIIEKPVATIAEDLTK